jgi:hypothetical protein
MGGSKPAVTLTIAGDADKLQRATKDSVKSVDDMGSSVAKTSQKMGDDTEKHTGRVSGAVGLAGAAIGAFAVAGGKHLFDLSKSMESLDVKAKTVFQDQLPSIQAWAEANRKAFGDSTRNVVAMAANLADLLKPMGFSTAQAAEMSKKILDLSGALSRWSGNTKSAKEVSELLADAMLGETDGLKALGISISAAEVDAKALSMGLGKTTVDMVKVKEATFGVQDAQAKLNAEREKHGAGSGEAARASLALEKAQGALKDAMAGGTSEISDQAKALATQQLILEKSTDAQTAWTEGGRAAAEQQNGLSSTMAESAEKLATIVAPAFERMVTLLGATADWMSRNQGLVVVLGGLAAAIWLVNVAMNANPMVLLATLALGLVAAIGVLWTQSAAFRDFFIDMWRWIQDAAGNAVDWVISRWNGLLDWFKNMPRRIGEALSSLGGLLVDVFKGGVNFLVDKLNWFVDHSVNFLIRRINDVSGVVGIPRIPTIPPIPKLHTAGVVPGDPGTEQLVIARAGERFSTGGGVSEGGVKVTGSGPLAEFIQMCLTDGSIQVVGR